MSNIIWQPQPKQRQFQERPEYEALYGGAAGGGKSDALLAEALRQVHIPHYKALILRKTYPQLAELVDRSRAIYVPAFPGVHYNAQAHCWLFPSGAKIYFGSMQHTKDRTNYQGKAYDFIGFDELTHFTYDEYSYLFSRNRPTGPGTRVYIRATTNPGGIGHAWVKQRFITAAPPLTPIVDTYLVPTPQGKNIEIKKSRIFVPSNVFDNQKLLDNDPGYLASLAMLPEAEKNALLYGSWDSFEGQVFTEWRNDPEHYRDEKWTHVIEPFRIPSYWRIYRGFDFGYQKPFSVGWYAASPEGMLYRIREYYGCDGTPNHGVQMNMADVAAQIVRIESEDENLKGRRIIGIADPSIFDASRGESIADIMAKGAHPVVWEPGDNHRIAGKMQFHYRFAFDDEGTPRFQVFRSCKHFIRTIPNLVYAQADVEDIDTTQEDHIYDECRYVLMANPITPRQTKKALISTYDPLNLKEHKKEAEFFRI
ncbi:MAG: terminase family protein [Clostridia bacterium]|nr:terminase family protein [Clostridia bacterium]